MRCIKEFLLENSLSEFKMPPCWKVSPLKHLKLFDSGFKLRAFEIVQLKI